MKRIQIIVLILIVGIVYFLTLPKGIGFGDAGTMAGAVVSLGIPHPPGFPTYLMLGHLFSLLPFGSMLWRLQLLSVLSALGVVILMPTIFTSLLVAFFYGFWSQAGNVESYMLTNLFIFGVTQLSLFETSPLIIGLLLGIGAGLNPIGVVVVPVLFYIYKLSKKTLKIFLTAIPAAVLVYLYIPLRAATHPFLNWGNPESFSNLLKYLGGSGLSINSSSVVNGFTGSIWWFFDAWGRFGYLAWMQLTPVVIGLAIYGAWILWKTERQKFWIWIIIILSDVSLAGIYISGNRDIWLVTSLIVLIILAGQGLEKLGKFKWIVGVLVLALIISISAPKILERSKVDVSGQYLSDLYQNLPQNSILIGGGETFNALTLYAHEVAKIRTDVTPIDMTIYYGQDWYQNNLKFKIYNLQTSKEKVTFADDLEFSRVLEDFASKNSSLPAGRQVFVTGYLLTQPIYANSLKPAYIPQKFNLKQNGLVYQLVSKDEPPIFLNSSPIWPKNNYLESNYQKAIDLIRLEYAFSFEKKGDYFLNKRETEKAFEWYTKATQASNKYFDQNKLSEKIIDKK